MALRKALTENGVVVGRSSGIPSVTIFKGIPYAAPPVGELRWRAPQPVKSWEGEYKAWAFTDIPMQNKSKAQCCIDEYWGFGQEEPMSEDCLYLHIWTPAKSADEKLPVMIYIHGGGMCEDYAYDPMIDGDAFAARQNVVMVSVEYRLGIFGFFAHPELSAEDEHGSSGCFGMLDQVAAIKWVHRNIGAFGGDPENILIFGQSAGGASVTNQICSPLVKDDIKKAIIMSAGGYSGKFGSLMGMNTLAQAEAVGVEVFEMNGIKNVAEARALSAEKLLDIQIDSSARFSFRPCIDGYFLTKDPNDVIADNEYHKIPVMVGCVEDEVKWLEMCGSLSRPAPEEFENFVRAKFGDKAENFLQASGYYEDIDHAMHEDSNVRFQGGALAFCELASSREDRADTYMYWFDRHMLGDDLGPTHSVDLWYVFNTIHRWWRPLEQKDLDAANAMNSYFAAFARNGDPNCAGLPEWKAYSATCRAAMGIGDSVRMINYPGSAAIKVAVDAIMGR